MPINDTTTNVVVDEQRDEGESVVVGMIVQARTGSDEESADNFFVGLILESVKAATITATGKGSPAA